MPAHQDFKRRFLPHREKALQELSVRPVAGIVQQGGPAQMANDAVVLPDCHAGCSVEETSAAIACMFPQAGRRADLFSARGGVGRSFFDWPANFLIDGTPPGR